MSGTVTILLQRMSAGDSQALNDLVPMVYTELRRMASSYLRGERPDHTLQPTALVHEAYLRLVDQHHPDYQSRAHFYGVASHVMRQILVDSARRKSAAKRGSLPMKVTLQDTVFSQDTSADLVVEVDDALCALEQRDPLKARLIEMRFFGGMTAEESATTLDVPLQTVRRQLRVALAWLQREMDHSRTLPKSSAPPPKEQNGTD